MALRHCGYHAPDLRQQVADASAGDVAATFKAISENTLDPMEWIFDDEGRFLDRPSWTNGELEELAEDDLK